ELGRIRELDQEYLVSGDRPHRCGRRPARERMETVEDDADRLVVGPPHDLPGVAIIVDMAAPGQRLEADAQAALRRQLSKLVELGRGPIDAAERGRRDVAADQEEIGLELLHQVELPLRPRKAARTLRLRHALEIPERLEGADLEPEIAAEVADIGRAA